LIQLNSFGCDLDAVTTDQVSEILESSNKQLYTVLKIDEVNNLGAARIRIRSLLAAMNQRRDKGIVPKPVPVSYHRTEYTKDMFLQGYIHCRKGDLLGKTKANRICTQTTGTSGGEFSEYP